jgi:hypothetical protein
MRRRKPQTGARTKSADRQGAPPNPVLVLAPLLSGSLKAISLFVCAAGISDPRALAKCDDRQSRPVFIEAEINVLKLMARARSGEQGVIT